MKTICKKYNMRDNNYFLIDGRLPECLDAPMVRDGEDKYIKADDYAGTIIIALELAIEIMEKDLKEHHAKKSENIKKLKKIKDNLVFLQNNYKVSG